MLRLIVGNSLEFAKYFIESLDLEKKQEMKDMTIYQKGGWLYAHAHTSIDTHQVREIVEVFLPERIYFISLGYAIDVVHEVGDVIAPNVFFPYAQSIENTEITEENRDHLVSGARFLSYLPEQKDYYVEDFGLSLGGIVVDSAPSLPGDDLMTKMMLAYEADVYTMDDLQSTLDIIESDDFPALLLTGVTVGKKNTKYPEENPIRLTVKNIITTIKLLEEDEK